MRRRIFTFVILVIFIFSQATVADARGFRGGRSFGGSHSFSSKSFSSKSWSSSSKSSKSWSGTSSSKSGWNGSSSSGSTKKSTGSTGYSGSTGNSGSKGYSGSGSSSSRGVPGSYSASGTKAQSTSRTSTRKNAYMQDAYKKQASSASYSKYKQKLNTEQQKVYDSSMKSNFSAGRRMNFEDSMRTRTSRINNYNTRRIYVNVNPVYFGSPFSYGHAYVGMWDLWFLMRASDLFWYHHWNEIYPYRDYFQAREFAEMEARVKRLEQQNNGVRDASYMEEGVDPDLQLSDEYQQAHPDSVYYTDKYSSPSASPVTAIIIILIIAGVLIVLLKKAAQAKPRKTYNSRIY